MKVIVIGSGGAFDTERTNSSFMIETKEKNILVDCGYNVFPKLKKDYSDFLNKIDLVYITHMDDDHMGSLTSLIYYRYYVLKKKTVVIYGYGKIDNRMVEYLKAVNGIWSGGRLIQGDVVEVYSFDNLSTHNAMYPVKGYHHVDNIGIIVGDGDHSVFISGDTKALPEIESKVRYTMEYDMGYSGFDKILMLHDFSFFDHPSSSGHASKNDMISEYSDEFREELILYHNNVNEMEGGVFEYIDNKWVCDKKVLKFKDI